MPGSALHRIGTPASGLRTSRPPAPAGGVNHMEEIAMTITKTAENGTLRIALEGRLDTNTATQLEAGL